ncbi:hypothetical protein U1Q18_050970 [Sarracenia purpurea var. burkii]
MCVSQCRSRTLYLPYSPVQLSGPEEPVSEGRWHCHPALCVDFNFASDDELMYYVETFTLPERRLSRRRRPLSGLDTLQDRKKKNGWMSGVSFISTRLPVFIYLLRVDASKVGLCQFELKR